MEHAQYISEFQEGLQAHFARDEGSEIEISHSVLSYCLVITKLQSKTYLRLIIKNDSPSLLEIYRIEKSDHGGALIKVLAYEHHDSTMDASMKKLAAKWRSAFFFTSKIDF